MPTNTFFRLPGEKRQRLMEAAWEEFSRRSFAEVSINRIVLAARIPRGSFYQYFEDKEDLFHHLVGEARDHFRQELLETIGACGGDLFAMPLQFFDRLLLADRDPWLERFINLLRVNREMDMGSVLCGQESVLGEDMASVLDVSRLRRTDPAFVERVFSMVLVCTATAILAAIAKPGNADHERGLLADRVEILEYGSLRADTLTQEEEKP